MKKLSIIIASVFSILSVSAQYNGEQNDRRDNDHRYHNRRNNNYNNNYNQSIVTLTLKGNSNEQVLIDGQSYSARNYGNNGTIQITNLQPGQHSLQVNSGNGSRSILGSIFGSRNNNNNTSTTFNLRSGYDMNIIVNANGRARIRETRSVNYQNNSYNQNRGYNNYNR